MRKQIRNLLNKIGYDIVKVNVHSESKARKIRKVNVGKFMLDMPGNNPHISNYKYDPDANGQLGRLAACVNSKYPGHTAIDIGANVGDTIAVIKSVVDIPVIGIEGDPVSYAFLERNTAQFRDISLIKEFLGEKRETIQVKLEKAGWNATLVPAKEQGQELTLKTLDEVLIEKNLAQQNIKLLKLDTEGFDTIILRGATELINTHHPVLYFEFNRSNMEAIGEDGLATLFSFAQNDYDTVLLYDNKGRYMLHTLLRDTRILEQLHYYAEEDNSQIAYYDVCLFHRSDRDLAEKFIQAEGGLL
jgi:FkbM family methyltransferase